MLKVRNHLHTPRGGGGREREKLLAKIEFTIINEDTFGISKKCPD